MILLLFIVQSKRELNDRLQSFLSVVECRNDGRSIWIDIFIVVCIQRQYFLIGCRRDFLPTSIFYVCWFCLQNMKMKTSKLFCTLICAWLSYFNSEWSMIFDTKKKHSKRPVVVVEAKPVKWSKWNSLKISSTRLRVRVLTTPMDVQWVVFRWGAGVRRNFCVPLMIEIAQFIIHKVMIPYFFCILHTWSIRDRSYKYVE